MPVSTVPRPEGVSQDRSPPGCFAVKPFLKEFVMTDTELRWLMFSALGAMVALPPLTSVGKADDVARATENLNIERTLKIVSAREADTEASEIVIAPAGQTDGENNAPILIG